MGDDLYKLIPKEGKHLAESHDTEGAFRGVYLDDETNKPSGAGEFIKVDSYELNDSEGVEAPDTENSSDAANKGLYILAGIGIGYITAKVYPPVKKWVTATITPWVIRQCNKILGKEEPVSLRVSEEDLAEEENDSTVLIIDDVYNEYRENMSSEDAQRELIEAFILLLESMKKVYRVANANVIDSEGRIIDGRALIEDLANKGMIESINEILRSNPALLSQKQALFLSEILGYEVNCQKEYIPITVETLSEGLFAD